jgi:hypothetical protein
MTDPTTTDPATGPDGDPPPAQSGIDRRYQAFAGRFDRAPGGRLLLKVVVFVLGLLFILGGLALVVLPGPLTIPPILVGVYLWSLEFGWAQRLRARAEQSARDAWESAKAHPVRASLITGAGLVAAAVAVWAVLHYDLVTRAKDALG